MASRLLGNSWDGKEAWPSGKKMMWPGGMASPLPEFPAAEELRRGYRPEPLKLLKDVYCFNVCVAAQCRGFTEHHFGSDLLVFWHIRFFFLYYKIEMWRPSDCTFCTAHSRVLH